MNDWFLGILLGTVGIVMVLGAMTGSYGPRTEIMLWTAVGIAWVLIAHPYAQRPWLAVLVAGVSSGVFAGIMQAAFIRTLIARNDAWAEVTVDAASRFQVFGMALVLGIVWGLLFAGVAWVVGVVLAQRKRPAMV